MLTFGLNMIGELELLSMPPAAIIVNHRLLDDGFYQSSPQYVFRVDRLESPRGRIAKTTGAIGHIYNNDLGNVERYRHRKITYIDDMFAEIDNVRNANMTARGIYFWPNENIARYFQLTLLRDSVDLNLNVERRLSGEHLIKQLHELSIISRIDRRNLPAGSFHFDPNPQLVPFGQLHLVGQIEQNERRIPLEHIEFWYNGDWVPGNELQFGELANIPNIGHAEAIVPPIAQEFVLA